MDFQIDESGSLLVNRRGSMVFQMCPRDFNIKCGDLCPLFSEPKVQGNGRWQAKAEGGGLEWVDGDRSGDKFVLCLCEGKVLVGDLEDNRPSERSEVEIELMAKKLMERAKNFMERANKG